MCRYTEMVTRKYTTVLNSFLLIQCRWQQLCRWVRFFLLTYSATSATLAGSIRFCHQDPVCISLPLHVYHMHDPRFAQPNNSLWRIETMNLFIMQFLQPCVFSSFYGPNMLHSILFSSIFSCVPSWIWETTFRTT